MQTSSEAERALYGYKAQCGLLSEHLETLIEGCEARMQSLICEGVCQHVVVAGQAGVCL